MASSTIISPWKATRNNGEITFRNSKATTYCTLHLNTNLPFFCLRQHDSEYKNHHLGQVFIPKTGWDEHWDYQTPQINIFRLTKTGGFMQCMLQVTGNKSLLITEKDSSTGTIRFEILVPVSLRPVLNEAMMEHGLETSFCNLSNPVLRPSSLSTLPDMLLKPRNQRTVALSIS